MTHNDKCEFAKGDLCRCECQGELHGIKEQEDKWMVYAGFCELFHFELAKGGGISE